MLVFRKWWRLLLLLFFYLCGGSIFGGGVDDNGLIDGGADGRVEVVHIYLFDGVGNDGGGSKQMWLSMCFLWLVVINFVLVVINCNLITFCYN